jgi:hypothetical protein
VTDEVPAAEVTTVAARLGRATAGVVSVETLYEPVASATAGVWRVRGEGWSSVLKLVAHSDKSRRRWQSGEEPSHWYYWRREATMFESGLFDAFADGLRAPQCYGIFERADGSVALWLEDLSGSGSRWPIERYEATARQLGRTQRRFVGASLPTRPWLSRTFPRDYVDLRGEDGDILRDDTTWKLAAVKAGLTESDRQRYLALWDARERRTDELADLPQTLCHFDFHPLNLFDASGDTVAIDWSFAGAGPIGADAATLVFDALYDYFVPPEHAAELFEVVARGYATGLDLPLDEVRAAMTTYALGHYAWTVPAALGLVAAGRETCNGRPIDEGLPVWLATGEFLLSLDG